MIHRKFKTLLIYLGLLAGCPAGALVAETIIGIVHNQTEGHTATGDEVILLRLNHGMQEEARTRTDSQGAFTLKAQFPDAMHLVRVVHQGVHYDQRASVGNAVTIDVFDTAAKVQGVSGSIEIIRIGTYENYLHVSDMIEIKNDSSPPLTQAGERTFEVYLPAHAKLDTVLASGSVAGSQKIGMMISAVPVPGEPDHYSVNFPLRPGPTHFAFNYDLPYSGHATFRTRNEYPLQELAVMFPPTMQFTSRSAAFQVLRAGNNHYQVEAASPVKAGEGPAFEISGGGALPPLQAQPSRKPPVAALFTPGLSSPTSFGAQIQAQSAGTLGAVPVSELSLSSRLQWWTLGACSVLLLGVCGFVLWGRQRRSANAPTTALPTTKPCWQTSASLIETLKEELFQLEINRLDCSISEAEYASAKQALEGALKRSLARTETVFRSQVEI